MSEEKIVKQFNTRASTYNLSANWISDIKLLEKHLSVAGKPNGKALELCCGTGKVGSYFYSNSWNVIGLDLSFEMLSECETKNYKRINGNSEELPFKKESFDLIILRQALFFLDSSKMFSEAKRVLKPGGFFLLSQTVPFSDMDCEWLRKIHFTKQAQLKRFYLASDLEEELKVNGFEIVVRDEAVVRESINKWMEQAPELSEEKKQEVITLVANAPTPYKVQRQVTVENEEVSENWYWRLLKAVKNG